MLHSAFQGVVDTQQDQDPAQNLLEEDRLSHHKMVEKDSPYRNEIEVDHRLRDSYSSQPFIPEDMT